MADSIFSKIIKGEIPCHKVYEDDLTIAFLPLKPIAIAHVLVVSKLQVDQFYDLPAEDYQAFMNTVKKVAERLQKVIKPKRIGLKIIGLDEPHAHAHVVAFDTLEEYNEHESDKPEPDHTALAEMAKKLAF